MLRLKILFNTWDFLSLHFYSIIMFFGHIQYFFLVPWHQSQTFILKTWLFIIFQHFMSNIFSFILVLSIFTRVCCRRSPAESCNVNSRTAFNKLYSEAWADLFFLQTTLQQLYTTGSTSTTVRADLPWSTCQTCDKLSSLRDFCCWVMLQHQNGDTFNNS